MYLRNEKGAPHGDDKLYMTGVPNGRKSLCEWESFAEQIVGTLNTGASPTVTEVSIPNGDHASDPKIGGFYSEPRNKQRDVDNLKEKGTHQAQKDYLNNNGRKRKKRK